MSTYREITGSVSARFESGTRGVKTVSTGKGDNGGVSYGAHQLASNNGSMAKFVASKFGAPYAARFAGLKPGTSAFTSAYNKIAAEKPLEFETNQFLYIAATHYDPQAAKLLANGIATRDRHVAVRECVFSVAVQYGARTSAIVNALGANFKGTDLDFIKKVQAYRRDTVKVHFKSSSKAVQDSIVQRSKDEEKILLELLKT